MPDGALGVLAYGPAPGEGDEAGVPHFAGPGLADAWCTSAPAESGQCGRVRWRSDGHWLWGAVEVDGAAALEAAAHQAYRDIFATLQATGCEHPQRFWNYLPRINADGGGLERYRQFNKGRQQAFLEARRPAFEGAPAACAIGTPGGPLRVRFIAAKTAPQPVENPRQVSAYHYPPAYGPASPTFSRAALIDAGAGRVGLLISGTASIVGHESRHAGDVLAQTRETLANLGALLGAAHERSRARFALSSLEAVVYLRTREHLPLVQRLLAEALGPAAARAVFVEADICRAELLVEIEAHAFASEGAGQ